MRKRVVLALASVLCLAAVPGIFAYAKKKNAADARQFLKQIPDDQKLLQALNRLTFGPRPGDAQDVKAIGLKKWIDQQLHPERIPFPAALATRLNSLDAISMSQGDLVRSLREANKAKREAKQEGEDKKNPKSEELARVIAQGMEARMLSAIYSPRQLEEVMSDFWFNHFNVHQGKGIDRVLVANYEREAIRPHVLGRFRDLLGATAHHPAMLFYLDNWLSAAPGYQPQRSNGPLSKVAGLNENYAREIMELHTLGVDGGYTQKDVTELARILTGWTIDYRGNNKDLFHFESAMHDRGEKQWLGYRVKNDGEQEAEWAMDILARHPATAHFISYKLAQYFVSDQPPAELVERMSKEYLRSDGQIRSVLATLFASPEFRDPANVGKKFKTPYQYVVSVARAADEPVENVRPLLAALYQLGMPLYGCPTPIPRTGMAS